MNYLPHIDRPHFDAKRVERLLQYIGHALAMVQELEFSLATYLSIAVDLSPGAASDFAERVFEKNEGKTLGRLLTELRKSDRLPGELVTRLEALRPERNWLAHRSNRTGRDTLNHPERFASVLNRLAALSVEALEISKAVSTELDRIQVERGITPEVLDQRTREIIRQWGG